MLMHNKRLIIIVIGVLCIASALEVRRWTSLIEVKALEEGQLLMKGSNDSAVGVYLDDIDNQTLSISGDTLSISNGNSVRLTPSGIGITNDTNMATDNLQITDNRLHLLSNDADWVLRNADDFQNGILFQPRFANFIGVRGDAYNGFATTKESTSIFGGRSTGTSHINFFSNRLSLKTDGYLEINIADYAPILGDILTVEPNNDQSFKVIPKPIDSFKVSQLQNDLGFVQADSIPEQIWEKVGNDRIYYNDNSVGIGTDNPDFQLTVNGTAKIGGVLFGSGQNNSSTVSIGQYDSEPDFLLVKNSILIGKNIGSNGSLGGGSVIIGANSSPNSIGFGNTFVGTENMSDNINSNLTISIGDANIVGGSGVENSIVIGNEINLDDRDNFLTIGNLIFGTGLGTRGTTVAGGRVGINENNPDFNFHTVGSVGFENLTEGTATKMLYLNPTTFEVSFSDAPTQPDLTPYDNHISNDNDLSNFNEIQTLSLTNNTLSIEGGNSISLTNYVNTDGQTLSISGNTLTISGGNSVTLPSGNGTSPWTETGSEIYYANDVRIGGTLKLEGLSENNLGSDFNQILFYDESSGEVKFDDIPRLEASTRLSNGNAQLGLRATTRKVEFIGENGINVYEDNDEFYFETDLNFSGEGGIYIDDLGGGSFRIGYSGSGGGGSGGGFSGIYTDLNFSGTSGLSDGVDNDGQMLSISGNTLTISGGNSVTLPSSGGGGGSGFSGNYTDLNFSGTSGLADGVDNFEANTDNQTLSINGSQLTIAGGNTVTLPTNSTGGFSGNYTDLNFAGTSGLSDGVDNIGTDNQTLSISGNTLSIAGGNSVTLPSSGGGGGTVQVFEGDSFNKRIYLSDTNSFFSINAGDNVQVSQGAFKDFTIHATSQVLTLSGNTLSISGTGGNSVTLPSSQWSNNSNGIHYFSKVGIGKNNPFADLDVAGDVQIEGATTLFSDNTLYNFVLNDNILSLGNIDNNIVFDGSRVEVNLSAGSSFVVDEASVAKNGYILRTNSVLGGSAEMNLGYARDYQNTATTTVNAVKGLQEKTLLVEYTNLAAGAFQTIPTSSNAKFLRWQVCMEDGGERFCGGTDLARNHSMVDYLRVYSGATGGTGNVFVSNVTNNTLDKVEIFLEWVE